MALYILWLFAYFLHTHLFLTCLNYQSYTHLHTLSEFAWLQVASIHKRNILSTSIDYIYTYEYTSPIYTYYKWIKMNFCVQSTLVFTIVACICTCLQISFMQRIIFDCYSIVSVSKFKTVLLYILNCWSMFVVPASKKQIHPGRSRYVSLVCFHATATHFYHD